MVKENLALVHAVHTFITKTSLASLIATAYLMPCFCDAITAPHYNTVVTA